MDNLYRLFSGNDINIVLGVYDPLSAKLAELRGFKCLWVSGFCVSTSLFIPDENVITVEKYAEKVAEIKRVCNVPLIVDCDEGYGSIENSLDLFERLSQLGVEACCIEDNIFPKTNSFKEDKDGSKAIVDPHEFAEKISILKKAFPQMVIIARTEALIIGNTMEDALYRARLYKKAGAELIVIHSRSRTTEDFSNIARQWGDPQTLVVIPTLAEEVSAMDLNNIGYKAVIYANQLLRANIYQMKSFLNKLSTEINIGELKDSLVSMDYIFNLIDANTNVKESSSYS